MDWLGKTSEMWGLEGGESGFTGYYWRSEWCEWCMGRRNWQLTPVDDYILHTPPDLVKVKDMGEIFQTLTDS